jgi:glycosyltransferase involved in cell wall biosynthesis
MKTGIIPPPHLIYLRERYHGPGLNNGSVEPGHAYPSQTAARNNIVLLTDDRIFLFLSPFAEASCHSAPVVAHNSRFTFGMSTAHKINEGRVAIFVSFSGEGGVERMILNLAGGLRDEGFDVDLVLVKARGAHVQSIPAGVRVVKLNARHTLTSLPALVRYLRKERPQVLLAAKDRAIKTAVLARAFARVPTRLVGRLGTTLSAALHGRNPVKKRIWYTSMRLYYRYVDRIVAVSQGVADDVLAITGLSRERVAVVRNPVWTPELARLAQEPADHPWFQAHDTPVILGAGRLTRQKDFATLIRAFAEVRARRPCLLILLGEGSLRSRLEALASELNVRDDVSLPGFVANPYAWIARAHLFVLSSLWEGSPNVLTEALALGVPVVATDCPSGPREILKDGEYGTLVPMGDVSALARAMAATLDHPRSRERLQEAARPYTVEQSVRGYLVAFGLAARNT